MISVQKDKTSVPSPVPCGVGGWMPGPGWPSRPPPQGSIPSLDGPAQRALGHSKPNRGSWAAPPCHRDRRVKVPCGPRHGSISPRSAPSARTHRAFSHGPSREEGGAPLAFGPQGECGRLHGWRSSRRGRGWTAGAVRSRSVPVQTRGERLCRGGSGQPGMQAVGLRPLPLHSFLHTGVKLVSCEVL